MSSRSDAHTTQARVNRLGRAAGGARGCSPYLLQHATNPVDWYPWGEEAFEAARSQNKPIFLSIGYSTCYWCHVMERECFENENIAHLMNEHFISVKVDREERPDVDDIYMTAVQVLNHGQGGWPMSVFLEPEKLRPFFAGTYFPPDDRYGRPSFPHILQTLADVWRNRREEAIRQAEQVAAVITHRLSGQDDEPHPLDDGVVRNAVAAIMHSYDEAHGGFSAGGRGPKFPQPVFIDLLIDSAWNDDRVRHAVTSTLNRMAMGGMYDQVGGGFHRYSVDEQWLVPHFEKMLYDNGQLLSTYCRAFEKAQDDYLARVIRQTVSYALREMTGEGGAFFSAQDAEVDSREGLSYLWTADEVRDVLVRAGLNDDVDFALEVYGLVRGPNFKDPHHPDDEPKNVLYLIDHPNSLAAPRVASRDVSVEDLFKTLDRINTVLLSARNQREQPLTDDKILTGWNGLMIAGLADAGRAFRESSYIEAAERAAAYLCEHHDSDELGLLRNSRNGYFGGPAQLEDYALLIHGLLALHGATDRHVWLERAVKFTNDVRNRFQREGGGYFDSRPEQTELFVRTRNLYDGAVPSGNSMMAINLLDLHERTGNNAYLDDAVSTLRSMSERIADHPPALSLAVRALHRVLQYDPHALSDSHGPAQRENESLVRFKLERLAVSQDGGKAELLLTVEIVDAYHLNAHDPGGEGLIPFEIALDNSDVQLDAAYPTGRPYAGPAAEGHRVRVYSGAVHIPLALTACQSALPERVTLSIRYQVCSDRACLQPRTESVVVQLK